jgi:hypothetical protein
MCRQTDRDFVSSRPGLGLRRKSSTPLAVCHRHVENTSSTIGPSHGVFGMKKTKSATAKKRRPKSKISHPGMMGDGTEEQNLGERGNPAARIKKKEVAAAFGKKKRKK